MPTLQKIVAIIDDDPAMRTSTVSLLSAFGYGTETFNSAEAFLNAAETSEAICLVIDIQLGKISGIELGRQLAATGSKLPIIFVTGCDNNAIRAQADELGCIAYLNKPFRAESLIEGIETAIGKIASSHEE